MFYNHITLKITIHSFGWVYWKRQTLTEKKVDLETKNSFTYKSTPLMITLSSRGWVSWKSQGSLTCRKLEFKTKHQPLERPMQKWPKSRGPLGMRAMLVLNDMYTASSITGFLKFLSVNKVVKVSSGLPIFQITRLLQLLTTVTSEVWRNLWNEPGLNYKTRTEHEYYIYLIYWNSTRSSQCAVNSLHERMDILMYFFLHFLSAKPNMRFFVKKILNTL